MNTINCHVSTSHDCGTRRTTPFEMSAKQQSYKARFKRKVAEFAEKYGTELLYIKYIYTI